MKKILKKITLLILALVISSCSSFAPKSTETSAPTETNIPAPSSTPEPTSMFTETTAPTIQSEEYIKGQASFDKYFENLLTKEKNNSGSLFCEDNSGGVYEEYQNCESFFNLKEMGCYGRTTFDMYQEIGYASICQKIEVLEQASISTLDYFDLESNDWWKTLPAEVIPFRGGVTSLESDILEREELITGKLLGEINFEEITVEHKHIETILSSEEYFCGWIFDDFSLEAVLLADFDGDGIAELLLQRHRAYRSDSCHLGTGNNLGASSSVIINKDSPLNLPTIAMYINGN